MCPVKKMTLKVFESTQKCQIYAYTLLPVMSLLSQILAQYANLIVLSILCTLLPFLSSYNINTAVLKLVTNFVPLY